MRQAYRLENFIKNSRIKVLVDTLHEKHKEVPRERILSDINELIQKKIKLPGPNKIKNMRRAVIKEVYSLEKQLGLLQKRKEARKKVKNATL